MAGGDERFDNAIPMNSIGFFGLHAMTAGSRATAEEGGTVIGGVSGSSVHKLFVKDSRLTGFLIIGDTARTGIYTSLIRNRTPLEDLDFSIIENAPALAAFDEKYRGKILGGVI